MSAKSVPLAVVMAAIAIPVFLIAEEHVDLSIVHQIRTEAFENSKVMDHMFYLTDVYGPRLTNSPGFRQAADWVVKRMHEYGIDARLEKWGPFGRGWTYSHFEAEMIEPQYSPLIGFPLAWTPGTNGVVSGEPMIAVLRTDADLEKFKGKLKGKIVMTSAPRQLEPSTTPAARRFTDAELSQEAMAPDPASALFGRPIPRSASPYVPPTNPQEMRRFRAKVTQFLHDEQPALVIQEGYAGDGGTVFASAGGSREKKDPIPPPMVVLTPEHYNRICRLIEHKIPVKVQFNVQAQFIDLPEDSVNVIAEIPGAAKKDEVVMLGAHLDSWHGGTGATDNAAGSAVAIEAMRILKALNKPMDRTVRMALWSGEEQGLLGSKAYVKEHFADPEVMKPTAEHAKISGYFNYDNGTGKIRGIYLQGNDMARPIFQAWLEPFRDLGATTVTIRNTGGTDHQSFDAVGIPGFQFIQDPVEYSTRTHHSNMDVYDRIQRGDLMQASAIMASFVYNAATRPEMLPRKPLPKPQPRRDRDREGARPPATE
jgi:carboxypeptidase Q